MGWTAREYNRMEKLNKKQDEIIKKVITALEYIIQLSGEDKVKFIAKKELERINASYFSGKDDLVAERGEHY